MINFNDVKIPNKLSELLRRVVQDMRIVQERDNVEFYMNSWANVDETRGTCTVCAAGAFILAECYPDGLNGSDLSDKDIVNSIDDESMENDIMNLIDDIRTGCFHMEMLNTCERRFDVPRETLMGLESFSDSLVCEHDYDDGNYQDVVKWFNTAARFLEQRGH